MINQVTQVKPADDFKVYVYFNDGIIKLYDVKPLIDKGGVFKKISDIKTFKKICTVINGTLAWDITGNYDEYNCIDIDPEVLYSQGKRVKDPLEKVA